MNTWQKIKHYGKTVNAHTDRAYTKLNDLSFQYLGDDLLGYLYSENETQSELRTVSIIDNKDTTIKIDWCKIDSDEMSSSLKTHNLEGNENTLITSNIDKGNRSISIECRMNTYEETAYERYYAIRELWNTKAIITLDFVELVGDLVITSIGRPIENEDELVFSLSFEQISFAKVKRVSEVQNEYAPQLAQEKDSGVVGVGVTQIPPNIPLIKDKVIK